MLFLQINEYVHCKNIGGGKKKSHFKRFCIPESKNPSQVYQSSLECLHRFSHLPLDNMRRVFIYFRRFGPLNNLDSCEIGAQVRQTAAAEPTAAITACYCPSFCSPCYQEFFMVHDDHRVLKLGERSSFFVPSGKKQTAILSLLSTVRRVYYPHQHFQPGFVKEKINNCVPLSIIFFMNIEISLLIKCICEI